MLCCYQFGSGCRHSRSRRRRLHIQTSKQVLAYLSRISSFGVYALNWKPNSWTLYPALWTCWEAGSGHLATYNHVHTSICGPWERVVTGSVRLPTAKLRDATQKCLSLYCPTENSAPSLSSFVFSVKRESNWPVLVWTLGAQLVFWTCRCSLSSCCYS